MSDRAATLLGWSVLGLLVVGAEVAVLRSRLASLRAVCAASIGNAATRLLGVTAWMWLGWHLFAR